MRSRALLIAVLLASLGMASAADAAWQTTAGSGSAYTRARSLAAGNTPTTSVSNRSVTINWTATGGTVPVDGYVIRRFDTGGTEATVGAACSGTINALTCTENNVDPGNWRYTVTPARQNWRGAQSGQSTAVTVNAPALNLTTTNFTVLQGTTAGTIQNFKPGQTVTFRLDDPTTGTLLTGSITPSTVPANGTATVSVTIPSGIANGAHTVYAIGNNGDQTSAAITVNTGTGFFATGSYTGNAADNRAITGLGFNPQIVIVKAATAQIGVIRTDTMSGDNSKPMTGTTALAANRLQSLDANGFTLGTDAQVNGNGVAYNWMAFRASDGVLKTGTYTGNGTSLSPSGLGFSPEYVSTFGAGAQTPYQRFSTGAARSYGYASNAGITDGITSLNAAGFSLGSNAGVNTNGTAYHYAAFNDSAGLVEIGPYTGNNTDNRNITGVGVNPAYVLLRGTDTTARPAIQRPSSLAGDSSMRFDAAANTANQIQALQADGFQLGTSANANANTASYSYLAVKNGNPSPGCSSPGSATVTANSDAWIDQASPGTNNGAATSLQVRSQILNANRRALVDFALPSIPAGCSLSQATLNLFATTGVSGRTVDVYKAGAAWTENGVTWTNAPATTGAAASATSAAGARSWDVTSQTQAQYSGTDTGFIVRDSAEGAIGSFQQTYQSREGTPDAQDPQLFVAWN